MNDRKNSFYVDYAATTFRTASNASDDNDIIKDKILRALLTKMLVADYLWRITVLTLRDQRLGGMLDSNYGNKIF